MIYHRSDGSEGSTKEAWMSWRESRSRELIKSLCPKFVVRFVRSMLPPAVSWGPPLPTWDAASSQCVGYDEEGILRKTIEATRAVERGDVPYERDSILFTSIEYSWPLLASLLAIRAKRGRLHIADFGGSLGTTFRQNRKFLDELDDVVWTVVEQKHYVDAGRAEFQTDRLKFSHAMEESPSEGPYDGVVFGSVLNYLETPWDWLDRAHELGIPYLIIDRTHVDDGPVDHFRRQRVREPIYDATYPCRIFSKLRLEERLDANWRLIESWESEFKADDKFRTVGYFLARR